MLCLVSERTGHSAGLTPLPRSGIFVWNEGWPINPAITRESLPTHCDSVLLCPEFSHSNITSPGGCPLPRGAACSPLGPGWPLGSVGRSWPGTCGRGHIRPALTRDTWLPVSFEGPPSQSHGLTSVLNALEKNHSLKISSPWTQASSSWCFRFRHSVQLPVTLCVSWSFVRNGEDNVRAFAGNHPFGRALRDTLYMWLLVSCGASGWFYILDLS